MDKIVRSNVKKIDEILGIPIKVLDDGFVRVIDYMGSDISIVQAARVSYGTGTKTIKTDTSLIRYLMRNRHTSPFEMCEIKLHVRVPMDVWRQWIRHRTANVNEYSTRYSVAIESMHKTKPEEWRLQSGKNQQGSEGTLDHENGEEFTRKEEEIHRVCREEYNRRLDRGIAREQARKDLPLSTFTEAYWKIDLHNLLHFLELRMDQKAQYEIREYAKIIGERVVKIWCPIAWGAFVEYRIKSMYLSETEMVLIKYLVDGDQVSATKYAKEYNILEKSSIGVQFTKEGKEFKEKIKNIGITFL